MSAQLRLIKNHDSDREDGGFSGDDLVEFVAPESFDSGGHTFRLPVRREPWSNFHSADPLFQAVYGYFTRPSDLRARGRTTVRLSSSPRENLGATIVRLLVDVPVSDGEPHPADDIVAKWYRDSPSDCASQIQSIFDDCLSPRPGVAASLLVIVSDVPSTAGEPWARTMALAGLQSPSLEVRDASVRFFERVGVGQYRDILARFAQSEPVSWLRDYALSVL